MEKKRLIFDIDGTILDYNSYYPSIINLFNYMGISYNKEDIENYIKAMMQYEHSYNHFSKDTYLAYLLRETNIPLNMHLVDYFFSNIKYLVPYDTIDRPTQETLDYLYSKYELVILTNYFKEVQVSRLEYLNMLKYFKEVYGPEQYRKPYKEAFLMASGPYKVHECVMIGDNLELDYMGAKNAGMDAILINPHNRQESIKILQKKL